MNKFIAALIAAVAAAPALAQTQGKAVATFTPPSCGEPGKALEISFELSIPGRLAPMGLIYSGCAEEGRNDYLPGYTERYYKGSDGYGLTLVTNHGDGAFDHDTDHSDVLVSKGKDWVARMGAPENAKIVSGQAMSADGYTLKAVKPADPPSVKQCEANLPKPSYGPNTLWLLTKTKAYYYREDCDICAELDSCDLKTGKIKEEIVAHSVSCDELAKFKKGEDVVFDGCGSR